MLKREAAKRDLLAQWVWYAENADIEVEDRFLRAAETTLALLAEQPMIGTPTACSAADLAAMRRFAIGDGFGKILVF
ncbi:MAG: type II toxin-antitoxin system RelE/ParE family toxin [Acidobacteriota bacterium]